ncbi:uncharacterized protein [Ptychodera flava]|uniref:uncharacterized protein n=1 Tax=Ptychodera flava TaxID=63121 RepID=UPI00396A7A0C
MVGVLAANKKTNSWIISSMVMCIISASLFHPILFGIMVVTMVIEANDACYYDNYDYQNGVGQTYNCDDDNKNKDIKLAIEGVILFLGFIDFIVAIVNSVYCCSAICCKSRNATPFVYYTAQPGGVPPQVPMATTQYGQQMIILPPGGPSAPPPYGPYSTEPMFVQLSAVPMAVTSAPDGQEQGAGYSQDQVKGGQSDTNNTLPPAYT